MTALSGRFLKYPFVEDDALEVDLRYRDLQRQGPTPIQLPVGPPCWLATRYADVRSIFTDRRFSRVKPPGTEAPRMSPSQETDSSMPLGMDPPQHTRLRRITSPVFSPRGIRPVAEQMQGFADGLLDRMEEQGPGADFVAAYAWDLPILVLTATLGVPASDARRFRGWVETVTAIETSPTERFECTQHIKDYVSELVEARRARHHDDLLGHLVETRDAGDRLSEEELRSLVLSLIVGGFETTATQLGSTVYALMSHRELWRDLVEGRAALDAALEELWRWIPGFRYGMMFVRWAKEDVELSGGVTVRAGEAILPEQSVANRDEAAFPNGWQLDFHRVKPRPHLALGFGEHLCMGIHLAKLQVSVTVESLLRRFPTLELAIPVHEVPWPRWTFMRTVGELPLTW
jgi:cytochrome P450